MEKWTSEAQNDACDEAFGSNFSGQVHSFEGVSAHFPVYFGYHHTPPIMFQLTFPPNIHTYIYIHIYIYAYLYIYIHIYIYIYINTMRIHFLWVFDALLHTASARREATQPLFDLGMNFGVWIQILGPMKAPCCCAVQVVKGLYNVYIYRLGLYIYIYIYLCRLHISLQFWCWLDKFRVHRDFWWVRFSSLGLQDPNFCWSRLDLTFLSGNSDLFRVWSQKCLPLELKWSHI